MRVMFDINTRRDLGAASEEMEAQYLAAKKDGKGYLEVFIGGCKHKVIVRQIPDLVRTPKPPDYVPRPPFFDPAVHRAPPLRRES